MYNLQLFQGRKKEQYAGKMCTDLTINIMIHIYLKVL